MQIYIHKSGQQTGPFSTEQVQSMLNSGMISLSDSAWREGMASWAPLHQILNVPPPVSGQTVSTLTAQNAAPASNAKYLYIPTSRLIFMSIISVGLYEAYWIYRNWRYLKERDNLKISPFWRGVFGVFFINSLLKEIKSDADANRIQAATFSPGLLAAGWIIMVVLGNAASRIEDPTASLIGMLVTLPSFCFILPVQNYINAVNEAAGQRPEYYKWSGGHIFCLVVGIIAWFGYLSVFFQ